MSRRLLILALVSSLFAWAQDSPSLIGRIWLPGHPPAVPDDFGLLCGTAMLAAQAGGSLSDKSNKQNAIFGCVIASGISDALKEPFSSPTQVQQGASTFRQGSLGQPTEARRLLLAPSPSGAGLRYYVLNAALEQETAQGVASGAPHLVDFLRFDFAYEARVNLDEGINNFTEPRDMALTNDGQTLIVVTQGSDDRFPTGPPVAPHLTLIDTTSARITRRIDLPPLHLPRSLTLSPDGSTAYVAALELTADFAAVTTTVLRVDLVGGAPVARANLQGATTTPGDIVITPDGRSLFVHTNRGIYMLDAATLSVATIVGNATVVTGSGKMAISPSGSRIYFESRVPTDPNAAVGIRSLDTASATVLNPFAIPGSEGGSRQDVGVTPDGRVLLHVDSLSGLLTALDAESGEVLGQLQGIRNVYQAAVSEGP